MTISLSSVEIEFPALTGYIAIAENVDLAVEYFFASTRIMAQHNPGFLPEHKHHLLLFYFFSPLNI